MKVQSILNAKGTRVVTTRPDATIAAVVRRFRNEGIGALVVSDDGTTVAGIISERDVIRGLAEHGAGLLDKRAAELITGGTATCDPDDTVDHLMARMTHRRIRHLPVVKDGKLSGIVSIGDVVKSRLDDLQLETDVLRDAYRVTQSRLM